MKMRPSRGSHLPVLMKAIELTSGPVLELGSGMYSTTYLHWACYPKKRKLVTYESNPKWFEFANLFVDDFHQVHCIADWDSVDVSEPWSVALVDHAPDERRVEEIKKLVHSEYIVVHDTEKRNDGKYKYSTVFDLFKYRYKYREASPHTSVFSNQHDLKEFMQI